MEGLEYIKFSESSNGWMEEGRKKRRKEGRKGGRVNGRVDR